MSKIRTIEDAEKALFPYIPLVAQLTGKDTTLERVKPLASLAGHPENQLKVIHIAGTSGKTSTAYYIAALLRAAGKNIGLTVSPHIDSITERVQINGHPLPDKQFCSELEQFLKIVKSAPQAPSFFELLYVFSLWVFARAKVDYAVVETGMGGLFDATNIVTRLDKVCVITDIGLDHMHILGDTVELIAKQKIGIVHSHNPVFMYNQSENIMAVIKAWTDQHQAPLTLTDESIERQYYGRDMSGMPNYQQRNWLLAYRTYRFLEERDQLPELSPKDLEDSQGLQVPVRMERLVMGSKTIVMDGAHNTQKMEAFVQSFRKLYPDVRPAILISLKQGKDFQGVVPILAALASRIIVTTFKTTQDLPVKSMEPSKLADAFKAVSKVTVQVIADQQTALDALLAGDEEICVITGSFYLLSQLRRSKLLV